MTKNVTNPVNPVNTAGTNITTAYLLARRWSDARSPVPIRAWEIPNFKIGAATAACQIEGIHGRGRSHWESYFEQREQWEGEGEDRERVNCVRGVDHFTHWAEDVDHMARMGLASYRFSICWPRIMPSPGVMSEEGVAFYNRLIDKLLEKGIEPNVTCYHWDLPEWVAANGGWLNRLTPKLFGEYCGLLGRLFGDRVKRWGTINEPEVVVAGYIGEGLAPGLNNPKVRTVAAHNVMLGHAMGLKALREIGGSDFQIGLSLNLVPQEAVDDTNEKAAAWAEKRWQLYYSIYLDAILRGKYPDVVLEEMAEQGVNIQPGEMELISQPIDFLGINWYLRHVVGEEGNVIENQPGWQTTQMGWEIHAPAFTRMLVRMNGEYNLPPIYITENGSALSDTVSNGRIRDVGRMKYLHDHIEALEAASKAGVNIAGYYTWSFLDNLEWSCGYKMTFGLIHVNRKTMQRIWKDSAYWYRAMIRATNRKNRQPQNGKRK
ncbi:MAG TPA: family 1 glycosylhydrolase [Oculatellaceae cyanobacterium]